jgi:hypothetical protein
VSSKIRWPRPDPAHGLERAERVAQHLQYKAHHDDVELADLGRV